MRRFAVILVIGLFASTAIAKSHVPKANTKAAIKSYVGQAASVVVKKGPSCDTFSSKDWSGGDYYIFVLGPDDKLICHPNASLVGKPSSDIVDAKGRKIGEEIAAAGKKKGGSWVDYDWPKPGTTSPAVPKSSFATLVKGPDGKLYVVGAGGYGLK